IDFRGRAFGEGLGQDGSRGQSSLEAIIDRLVQAVHSAVSRMALHGTLPAHAAGASAPVFFRFGLSRGWMGLLVETMFNLVQDSDLILRLGIEVTRVIPLEMRLEFASGAPIGIAEMVVDHWIRRFKVDRPFELLHRLVVAAEFVIRPAKTIDNISV